MKKIKSLNWMVSGLFILLVLNSFAAKSGLGQNELTSEQKENAVMLIYKVRLQGCTCGTEYMPPVEAVVWNALVEEIALEHSLNMKRLDRFGHYIDGEIDLAERFYSRGFQLLAVGENIGIGQKTEVEMIDAWFYKSPSHRETLMHPKLKHIELAKAGKYWTLNMIGFISDHKKDMESKICKGIIASVVFRISADLESVTGFKRV